MRDGAGSFMTLKQGTRASTRVGIVAFSRQISRVQRETSPVRSNKFDLARVEARSQLPEAQGKIARSHVDKLRFRWSRGFGPDFCSSEKVEAGTEQVNQEYRGVDRESYGVPGPTS